MDKLKQYIALTVVGCLAVLAGGWFLLVSPKRSEAAQLSAQASTQLTANAALQTQIEVLKAQAKNLPKEQAKLAAVAAKVPPNRAMPALIRSLADAAEDAGVELVTLAPGLTEVAAAVVPAQPVAAAEQGGSAAPVARPAAPAGPKLGTIPVTLNVVGGYFQVQQFLSNLEELKRAIRFTSVALAPGTNPLKPASTGAATDPSRADGRTLGATLTGQVFQQVATAAAPAVAAPVAPAK